MRKRGGSGTGKSHANPSARSLLSRLPASPIGAGRSSKPYDFNFAVLTSPSSVMKAAAVPAAPLRRPAAATSPPQRTVATISDLKGVASSRTDAIRRGIDHSHAEILKEFEASHTRLAKRFKLQTQACLQLSDEVGKDYNKMSERIAENMELMKASYSELISEAQASASRVCKVTIPELAQSMEKAIDGLRSRYKLPLTSA